MANDAGSAVAKHHREAAKHYRRAAKRQHREAGKYLGGEEDEKAADAYVEVDDSFEEPLRNPLKDNAAQQGAYEDSSYAPEVALPYCFGEKAVAGAGERHCHIPDEKVGLRYCHIVLFCWRAGDKVEHRRRSLHSEEPAHYSADASGGNL